jgi:hypothetical protein
LLRAKAARKPATVIRPADGDRPSFREIRARSSV